MPVDYHLSTYCQQARPISIYIEEPLPSHILQENGAYQILYPTFISETLIVQQIIKIMVKEQAIQSTRTFNIIVNVNEAPKFLVDLVD